MCGRAVQLTGRFQCAKGDLVLRQADSSPIDVCDWFFVRSDLKGVNKFLSLCIKVPESKDSKCVYSHH